MKIWEVFVSGHVRMTADATLSIEGPDDLTEEEIQAVMDDLTEFGIFENAEGGEENWEDVILEDVTVKRGRTVEEDEDASEDADCRIVRDGTTLRVESIGDDDEDE